MKIYFARVFQKKKIPGFQLNSLILFFFIFFSNLALAETSSYLEIDFTQAEEYEKFSGGKGTVKAENKNAFSLPMKNIKLEKKIDFFVGNGLFKRIWVSSPASTEASDGLGPLFNSRACQRCHLKDGRGHPPKANAPGDNAVSMVLHLSIPPQTSGEIDLLNSLRIKAIPEPIYGAQLSDFSIQGILAEGEIFIDYEYIPIAFDNGMIITLNKPIYSIVNTNYGELHAETRISARVAQPMIGLGLIQSIDPKDILVNADEKDLNSDFISGKANYVWDYELNKPSLGLFGWKATQPNIRQQAADAFNNDMGLSTTLFPEGDNCTSNQSECKELPNGNTERHDNVEISNEQLSLIEFYASHLAVPIRRNHDEPNVLKGKKIFYQSGCVSCHTPKYETIENAYTQALSSQLIWPYSDFLLHDMGPGLADKNKEYLAEGNEWRTQPLWGIGLTEKVNGHSNLLHDGRANNIIEAILWHGGEAEDSKNEVLKLTIDELDQLIDFIESL